MDCVLVDKVVFLTAVVFWNIIMGSLHVYSNLREETRTALIDITKVLFAVKR